MNHSTLNNEAIDYEKCNSTKHLIDQNNFEKIQQLRREIQEITEFYPSLRKVINLFITDDTINQVRKQLIYQLL